MAYRVALKLSHSLTVAYNCSKYIFSVFFIALYEIKKFLSNNLLASESVFVIFTWGITFRSCLKANIYTSFKKNFFFVLKRTLLVVKSVYQYSKYTKNSNFNNILIKYIQFFKTWVITQFSSSSNIVSV